MVFNVCVFYAKEAGVPLSDGRMGDNKAECYESVSVFKLVACAHSSAMVCTELT